MGTGAPGWPGEGVSSSTSRGASREARARVAACTRGAARVAVGEVAWEAGEAARVVAREAASPVEADRRATSTSRAGAGPIRPVGE